VILRRTYRQFLDACNLHARGLGTPGQRRRIGLVEGSLGGARWQSSGQTTRSPQGESSSTPNSDSRGSAIEREGR